MRRNLGGFAISDLLPVIFRNGQNAVFVIQLAPSRLYRSLGEGRGGKD